MSRSIRSVSSPGCMTVQPYPAAVSSIVIVLPEVCTELETGQVGDPGGHRPELRVRQDRLPLGDGLRQRGVEGRAGQCHRRRVRGRSARGREPVRSPHQALPDEASGRRPRRPRRGVPRRVARSGRAGGARSGRSESAGRVTGTPVSLLTTGTFANGSAGALALGPARACLPGMPKLDSTTGTLTRCGVAGARRAPPAAAAAA